MDELELALDDCLQKLTAGKSSLAQCLARYPQYADQLRPMLEAALQVQRGKQLRPAGAVRDRTRAKVRNYIEEHSREPRKAPVAPRLAFILVLAVLALFLVGAAAAQSAMPGQPLYAVKLSTERAWRAAYPDPVKADLILADRHANELIQVAGSTTAQPTSAVYGMSAESQAMGAYVEVLDRLSTEINSENEGNVLHELKGHQDKLAKAGIHVPKLDEIVGHNPGQNDNPGETGSAGNGAGNNGSNGNGNSGGNGGGQNNGNGQQP